MTATRQTSGGREQEGRAKSRTKTGRASCLGCVRAAGVTHTDPRLGRPAPGSRLVTLVNRPARAGRCARSCRGVSRPWLQHAPRSGLRPPGREVRSGFELVASPFVVPLGLCAGSGGGKGISRASCQGRLGHGHEEKKTYVPRSPCALLSSPALLATCERLTVPPRAPHASAGFTSENPKQPNFIT